MAEKEVKLMKGNEVIAHAAIRYGCDGYFGYPITPQSEVMETLMELKPWETTGMVVLQAESEISSINMVYGLSLIHISRCAQLPSAACRSRCLCKPLPTPRTGFRPRPA